MDTYDIVIEINRASPISVSKQIADLVRDNIAAGNLSPGTRLPPVRQLAARAKTSIFPVAQALQRLEREGLVKLNHGGGAYVSRNLANPQKIIRVMLTYPNAPDLLDAFRKKHPEYVVIAQPYQAIHDDNLNKYVSGIKPPDVVSFSSEEFAYLTSKNFLIPLDGEISPLDGQGALQSIQETFRFRGQRLAAAVAVLPFLLLARRSVFTNCGLALPAPDWSGADLLALIRRLTQDADGDGVPEQYGYLITSRGYTWFYLYYAFGGDIASWRILASQPSRLAVKMLWEAIFKHRISPQNFHVPPGKYGDMLVAAAKTAKVGLMLADLNALRQCKRLFPNDLAPLRSPMRFDGKRASLAVVHGIGIPRTAVCREGALALIRFMRTPEAQRIICQPNNLLPVDTDLWNEILAGEKDVYDLLLSEMREARPMNYTETPEEMFAIMKLFEQLLSGFIAPEKLFAMLDARGLHG